MEIDLFKIDSLSGALLSCYSVCYDKNGYSVFEEFGHGCYGLYKKEIQLLILRLKGMSQVTGLNEHFYKTHMANRSIHYLYERNTSNIRVFFLKYGEKLIVLGGGVAKVKGRGRRMTFPESEIKKEIQRLVKISQLIDQKMFNKELEILPGYMDFKGDSVLYK